MLALRNTERTHTARNRGRSGDVDTLQVGDMVLARKICLSSKIMKRMGKVADVYEGPYQVVQKVGISAYELMDPATQKRRGIYNIDKLRRYFQGPP